MEGVVVSDAGGLQLDSGQPQEKDAESKWTTQQWRDEAKSLGVKPVPSSKKSAKAAALKAREDAKRGGADVSAVHAKASRGLFESLHPEAKAEAIKKPSTSARSDLKKLTRRLVRVLG
jgi:hypothetical protein